MSIYELEKESGGTVKQTKYLKKNPLRRYFIQQYLDSVLELAQLTTAKQALDVGCGEGFVMRHLRDYLPTLQVSGVDIEPSVLKVARYQNPDRLLTISSAEQLPFADQNFDLVFCNEVMEHLPSPATALQELSRISARYLILSVPREPHYRLANMVAGANWSRWGDDIDHLQRWTRKQFIDMLSQQFEIMQINAPFPWIMVLCKKTNLID